MRQEQMSFPPIDPGWYTRPFPSYEAAERFVDDLTETGKFETNGPDEFKNEWLVKYRDRKEK